MPHQCTNCGRAFADGSKEMLSGCPGCGGNKFQFHPGESVPEEPDTAAEPPDPPTPDSSVARTVGGAAATVKDLVGSGSPSPPGDAGPEPTPAESAVADENAAQASARSEVISPEEIPPADDREPAESAASSAPGETGPDDGTQPPEAASESDRPDLGELREELNDQFESIKVLEPGQYELNLMELYDREAYIIALQEDGRYTIQVPETWHDG